MKFRWQGVGLIVVVGCSNVATNTDSERQTADPAVISTTEQPAAETIEAPESIADPREPGPSKPGPSKPDPRRSQTTDPRQPDPRQPEPRKPDASESEHDSETAGLDDEPDRSGQEESKQEQSSTEADSKVSLPIESGLRQDAFRLLLPTSKAPLIVDVEIRINGIPLRRAFDQVLANVLQNAAGDSEDRSWRKLFEYVTANPIRFGNMSNVSRDQYRQMSERYDRNRNGQPDRDEVAKFLFRTSPHSSAFRLFGTNAFRGTNRLQSSLFRAMDSNADGMLDNSEIESVDLVLQGFDQNADQRIDANEVPNGTTSTDEAWKRGRSKRWGEVAMDLTGHVNWTMLSYMIGDLDRPGPFGQTRTLLSRIDENDDQAVSAKEAKRLLALSPDIRLLVSYDSGANTTIEVQELSDHLQSPVKTQLGPRQIGISDDSFRLTAQVTGSTSFANQFSDQAFAMFDLDKDGGLDKTEIPKPVLREHSFEAIDSDQDGKLTIQEIHAALAAKKPIWSVQVRARSRIAGRLFRVVRSKPRSIPVRSRN